ncbi:MAG: phosphatidylglycerophosphatase A [Candidatus Omnitrophica bacterium]|nr:phosphatidylglycerophosphatase A [Candidatus Omnitrophota bacterium]MBD3269267.1 phosphatidylglycerophosphatase A [Candidatus Omnitrophota bacterium]
MHFRNITVLSLASLFGIGYSPYFSGTLSCILALSIFLLIESNTVFFSLTIASVVLAFAISGVAEKILKEKDSKKIVIDDFSGMLVTFLFIPRTPAFIISGFFLFRMLDMIKIPPADKLEEFPGSRGVVGDDLVAALYANLILQTVRLLLKLNF